jgi:hypothetical protein
MEARDAPKSGPDVFARAREAGLDRALKEFPEDVAIAMQTAAQARSALSAHENVAAEPWPPMRVRSAT